MDTADENLRELIKKVWKNTSGPLKTNWINNERIKEEEYY